MGLLGNPENNKSAGHSHGNDYVNFLVRYGYFIKTRSQISYLYDLAFFYYFDGIWIMLSRNHSSYVTFFRGINIFVVLAVLKNGETLL